MVTQTIEEWREELHRRFPVIDEAAFVCPKCGGVQTVARFKENGIDPQRVYTECIGRHVLTAGCDWAAYGFLGTLGRGRVVDGKEIFDFSQQQAV